MSDADDPTKPNSLFGRLFSGRRQTSLHLSLSLFLSLNSSLALLFLSLSLLDCGTGNLSSLISVSFFASVLTMCFFFEKLELLTIVYVIGELHSMDCVLFWPSFLFRSLMIIADAFVYLFLESNCLALWLRFCCCCCCYCYIVQSFLIHVV